MDPFVPTDPPQQQRENRTPKAIREDRERENPLLKMMREEKERENPLLKMMREEKEREGMNIQRPPFVQAPAAPSASGNGASPSGVPGQPLVDEFGEAVYAPSYQPPTSTPRLPVDDAPKNNGATAGGASLLRSFPTSSPITLGSWATQQQHGTYVPPPMPEVQKDEFGEPIYTPSQYSAYKEEPTKFSFVLDEAGRPITSMPEKYRPQKLTYTEDEVADLPEGTVLRRYKDEEGKKVDITRESVRQEFADDRWYSSEFAGLDLAGVERVMERTATNRKNLDGMTKEWSDQVYDFTARVDEYNKTREEVMRLAASAATPEEGQRIIDAYNEQGVLLEAERKDFEKRQGNIEDLNRALLRDEEMALRRQYDINKEIGSPLGALTLSITKGMGKVASGAMGTMIDIVSSVAPMEMVSPRDKETGEFEVTRGQAAGNIKRMILPSVRSSYSDVARAAGISTTDEYYQDAQKGLLGMSILGVGESIPAMVTPYMAGFFLQSADDLDEELSDPKYDDIPLGERMALKVLIGGINMALERAGFRNMVKNNAFTKRLLARVVSNLPANATPGQIQRVIDAETRSALGNAAIHMIGAGAAEFETGFSQQAAEDIIRLSYNEIKGKDILRAPGSVQEFVKASMLSGTAEAIGAGVFDIPFAMRQMLATGGMVKKMDKDRFKLMSSLIRDEKFEEAFIKITEAQIASGKVTQPEVDKAVEDLRVAREILQQIPDHLPQEHWRKAFDLINEKRLLKKKDASLSGQRLHEIDAELKALVTQGAGKTAGSKTGEKPPTGPPTGGPPGAAPPGSKTGEKPPTGPPTGGPPGAAPPGSPGTTTTDPLDDLDTFIKENTDDEGGTTTTPTPSAATPPDTAPPGVGRAGVGTGTDPAAEQGVTPVKKARTPQETTPETEKTGIPEDINEQERTLDNALFSGDAQKNREAGVRTIAGQEYARQSEQEVPTGASGTMQFSDQDKEAFDYVLMEADAVQPSHINGRRNPYHFIPEAQPKTRTDKESQLAIHDIASNPDPDLFGASPNAYSGAPVVNARGEVIQGNNRSAAYKDHYAKGGTSYKEDLAREAAQFGFTPERVLGMKKPVLVRRVNVNDARAIELGNYDAKDIESGSKQGIDPSAVSPRIPSEVKSRITGVLFGEDVDATLKETLRDKFNEVVDALSPYLNPSQRSVLFKKDSREPSANGMDQVERLVRHFLFDGGPPDLAGVFEEGIPHHARNGIMAAVPSLFSSPESVGIIREVQQAIMAAAAYRMSGVGSFDAWVSQADAFGPSPSEVYTPTELAMARLFADANTAKEVREKLKDYSIGTRATQADMFTQAAPGKTRQRSAEDVFGITPQQQDDKGKQQDDQGRGVAGGTEKQAGTVPDKTREGVGAAEERGGGEEVAVPPQEEPGGVTSIARDDQRKQELKDQLADLIRKAQSRASSGPPIDVLLEMLPKLAELGYLKIKDMARWLDQNALGHLKTYLVDAYKRFRDAVKARSDVDAELKYSLDNDAQIKEYQEAERLGKPARSPRLSNREGTGRLAGTGRLHRPRSDGGRQGDRPDEPRPPIRISGGTILPRPKREAVKEGQYPIDEHQRLGVNLALSRFEDGHKAFMLADGVGVGKTREILAVADQYHQRTGKRVLILTKDKRVLGDSFKRDAATMNIDTGKFTLGVYDDLTKKNNPIKGNFGLVIFDESHLLKNFASQRAVASEKLGADHVMYVTATPFDKPETSIRYLRDLLGVSQREMEKRLGVEFIYHTDPHTQETIVIARLPKGKEAYWNTVHELRDGLVKDGAFIRREYPFWGEISFTTVEAPPQLGDDIEAVQEVANKIEGNAQYEVLSKWASARMRARGESGSNAAERRTLERMLRNGDDKIGEEYRRRYAQWLGQQRKKQIQAIDKLNEASKVDAAMQRTKEALANGEKVILVVEGMTEHKPAYGIDDRKYGGRKFQEYGYFEKTVETAGSQLQKRLKAEGIAHGLIAGGVNDMQAFNDDQVDVIVMTAASGGTGINLDDTVGDAPRRMIMVTPPWGGDTFEQTIGRVSRRNTASPSTVEVLTFSDNRADTSRQKHVVEKRKTLAAINEGADPDRARMMEEEVDGTERGDEEFRASRADTRIRDGTPVATTSSVRTVTEKLIGKKLTAALEKAGILNIVGTTAHVPSEIFRLPGLNYSQKAQRIGLEGTAKTWVLHMEADKSFDWNKVRTADDARRIAEKQYQEAFSEDRMREAMRFDAKQYLDAIADDFDPTFADPNLRRFMRIYKSGRTKDAVEQYEQWVEQERGPMLRRWKKYMEEDNDIYAKDPFFRAVVAKAVINSVRSTHPDVGLALNAGALAALYGRLGNGINAGVEPLYRAALLDLAKDNVEIGDAKNGWYKIPQTKKDDPAYEENCAKIRGLSPPSWCTSRGLERDYITRGDFWVYVENGRSVLAVRFDENNTAIGEIQGVRNNSTIPPEHADKVEALINDPKFKVKNETKNALAVAIKKRKVIQELVASGAQRVVVAKGDKPWALSDVVYFIREDGSIDVVDGDLSLDGSDGDFEQKLVSVGGDASISAGAKVDALTTVGGYAYISAGASAPSLTTVGGYAHISAGASAPALTTVGGYAYISAGASAPSLTTVGGHAHISAGASAPALTTVGRYAYISAGASAPSLTTVGGHAFIYAGAKVDALTTVGGNATISAGASAPALTTVGGNVVYDDAYTYTKGTKETDFPFASSLKPENIGIGKEAALKGTPLDPSKKQEAPQEAPRASIASSDQRTQGLTTPDGRVFVVASNIQQGEEGGVILHEALHAFVKKAIGDENWKALMGRINDLRKKSLSAKWLQQAEARARAAGVSDDLMAEEIAAYAIEEYENAPAGIRKWVADIIGFIKAALARMMASVPGGRRAFAALAADPMVLRSLAISAMKSTARKESERSASHTTVGQVMTLLKKIVPSLSVVRYDSMDEYNAAFTKAWQRESTDPVPQHAGRAFYDPRTGGIHLSPLAQLHSLAHEAIHPLLRAVLERDPSLRDALYEELKANPAFDPYIKFGEKYADLGETEYAARQQKEEAIVQFLADVAEGKHDDFLARDTGFAERLREWLRKVLVALGIRSKDIDFSDVKDLKEFAGLLSEALRTGRTAVVRGADGGAMEGSSVATRQQEVGEPPSSGATPPDARSPKPVPFDWMALGQLYRRFGKHVTISTALRRNLGVMVRTGREGEIKLKDKITWDRKLATRVLAHEIGHFIDLIIEQVARTETGRGPGVARRLAPLSDLEKQVERSKALKAQARELSAQWRGPFTPDDKYRNKASELFADYMSAMFNDPDMVKEKYPLLYEAFTEMASTKPEFRDAYNDLVEIITGGTMLKEFDKQVEEDTARTMEDVLNNKGRTKETLYQWFKYLVISKAGAVYKRLPKSVRNSLAEGWKDRLEYAAAQASEDNTFFTDDYNKKVRPHFFKIHSNPLRRHTIFNKYMEAYRVVHERRAAGLFIERNPEQAREMLQEVFSALGMNSTLDELSNVADDELYDFAAVKFFQIHNNKKALETAIDIIDGLELGVSGEAAMMAFNVRGKLDNPYSLTEDQAKALLENYQRTMPKERYDALVTSANALRELLFEVVSKAHDEGLISDKTWNEVIVPGRTSYAPFAVLDHWGGRVGAGVKTQKGTSKGVADITIATTMKASAWNAWRAKQNQVRLVMDVEEIMGGKRPIPTPLTSSTDIEGLRRRHLNDEISRLLYFIDGKPHVVEIRDDPGKMVEKYVSSRNLFSEHPWMVPIAQAVGVLQQLYTLLSPAFTAFLNPGRGVRTSLGRFGARATLRQGVSISGWARAIRIANNYSKAMVRPETPLLPETRELIEKKVLPVPRASSFGRRQSSTIEELLENGMLLAMTPEHLRFRRTIVDKVTAPIARFGSMYEALEKVMHYQTAMRNASTEKQAKAYAIRGGIPKVGVGGVISSVMELFAPWTRVKLQGLRTGIDILRDPTQRARYIRRILMYELIPRVLYWGVMKNLFGDKIAELYASLFAGGDDDEEKEEKKRAFMGRMSVLQEAFLRGSPYKMGIDMLLPIGWYDPYTGKQYGLHYFKNGVDVPDHYYVISFRLPSSEEGRILGPLLYNVLSSQSGTGKAGETILSAVGGWMGEQLFPQGSPIIEAGVTTFDVVAKGRNPINDFTGGPSLNPQLFDAGGPYRAEALAGYLFQQFGAAQWLGKAAIATGMLDERAMTMLRDWDPGSKKPFTENIPVLSTAFSFDNYKPIRERAVADRLEKKYAARARMVLGTEVDKIYRFYNNKKQMNEEERKEKMNKVELLQYEIAKDWANRVWLGGIEARDAVIKGLRDIDEAPNAEARKNMEKLMKQVNETIGMYSENHVLLFKAAPVLVEEGAYEGAGVDVVEEAR